MLKQKYFLADIFILSAEKQPIKLSWRKIEWLLLYGQNKVSQGKAYYNVEDGTLVCKIDTISQVFGSKVYYYFGKKREKVSLDVQFIGGYQALTNYFDSLYFNREDYNWDELNALFYYTILCDKDLKIKDLLELTDYQSMFEESGYLKL